MEGYAEKLKSKPWVCSPLPPSLHSWKQRNTQI